AAAAGFAVAAATTAHDRLRGRPAGGVEYFAGLWFVLGVIFAWLNAEAARRAARRAPPPPNEALQPTSAPES
ncbi:MAG: hypothetical protein AVDCRST_MAG11-430, partial [uncultured Gemmatimonadaceae bacterium]